VVCGFVLIANVFLESAEKKRRIYDQYGKEGLLGHNEGSYGNHHRRRHPQHDPFENDFIFGGFPFVFRDPEEVFREFFGGSPFDEIFQQINPGHSRRHPNGNAGGSRHHHHRSSHPQNVMSPFLSFSLMDDMFAPHAFGGLSAMNGGFTSLSTFNGSHGGGGGNVKRISTSTSFINGKKVVTKK
jgi:DnaJ homolog subfamily B member 6